MPEDLKIQNPRGAARLLRALLSALLLSVLVYLAFYHRTCVYLLRQAKGQAVILLEARYPDTSIHLSQRAAANLRLVPGLKKFTVDSLGFDATSNYEKIFYHGRDPVLWVVTASRPYSVEPVTWTFPVVGKVTYKGFFDKQLAALELHSLRARGMDVEISPVTAYSTLGWFSDPLFSGMLERSRGAFCNLIIHELFHATWYKAGEVNLNENLASFIAHKGTLQYLANDTATLKVYLNRHSDQQMLRAFLQRKAAELDTFYVRMASEHLPAEMKTVFFREMTDSLLLLPLSERSRSLYRVKHILAAGNAYFVGYDQYESLQDSLENAFNKNYRGSIKKMVHDLKRR